MHLYRICLAKHASALDGEGAKLFGARWNSPGLAAIYTSTHLSLAALECFVHVDFENLPESLVWLRVEIPEGLATETYPGKTAPEESKARAFGNDWLKAKRTLALFVPSAVISIEQNVVLNPNHPAASKIKIAVKKPFNFDARLFK